jgi:hypothetical protein
MNNEKKNNGSDVVKPYIPVLAAVILTFGGTLGGNYLLVRDAADSIIVPDRFTGTEGREFERRIDEIEREDASLRRDLDNMPPRELTERILRLEVAVQQLKRDIERAHP